jgi:flavin-dependent dehydrogenase
MYDIAIIGSGPAGVNLARLIGNKYKILLLDKRGLDQEKFQISDEKCCGGLLAPDAQKIIAKLCLGIPKNILVNPQLFAVRAIDLTNNLDRLYQRFYINLDRKKFDKWLIFSAANRG